MKESLITEKLSVLLGKYRHRQKRSEAREKNYEDRKKDLSIQGYWSMGYYGGKSDAFMDVIDDLEAILASTKKEEVSQDDVL